MITREMDGSNLGNVVFKKELRNNQKLYGMMKSLVTTLYKSSTPSDRRGSSKDQSQETKTQKNNLIHTLKYLFDNEKKHI